MTVARLLPGRRVLIALGLALVALVSVAGVAYAADGCACGGGGMGGAAAGGAAAAAGLVAGAAAGYGAATSGKNLTNDCAQLLGAFNGLAAQRAELRGRLQTGLNGLRNAYGVAWQMRDAESELEWERGKAFALLGGAAALSSAALVAVGSAAAKSYALAALAHGRTANALAGLLPFYPSASLWQGVQFSAGHALQNFARAQALTNAGRAAGASVGVLASLRAFFDGGMSDFRAARARQDQGIIDLETVCQNLHQQMHAVEARMDEMRPRLQQCGITPSEVQNDNIDWPSRVPRGGIRG